MLIYIFLLIYVLFLWLVLKGKGEKRKLAFLISTFSAMFIIQALRAQTVGVDVKEYCNYFYQMHMDVGHKMTHGYVDLEPGYLLINKLVLKVGVFPQLLLAVCSFIILCNVAIFIYKNSDDVYISTFLFLTMNHFFTSMTSIRQYLALSIALHAVTFFRKRKPILLLVALGIAASFHKSVLIFGIMLILLYYLKPERKSCILVIAGCIGCFSMIQVIFPLLIRLVPKYLYLLKNTDGVGIGKLRLLYIILEIIIIIYILVAKRRYQDITFLSVNMLMVGILIGLLQRSIPHIWRMGYYFDFFLVMIIPQIIRKLSNKRQILNSVVIVAGSMLYIYLLITDGAEVVPYAVFR